MERETDKGLGKSKHWRVLAYLGDVAADEVSCLPSTCDVFWMFPLLMWRFTVLCS